MVISEAYIERVLKRFNMRKVKFICSPLAGHFKFSFDHCPTSEKGKQEMRGVLYVSSVGSLMYTIVCIRPYIAHAVGVVSWFFSNLGKE